MSIALIVISILFGAVTSLTVAQVNEELAIWQWRLGIGLIAFVVLQFCFITPIRLWRNSAWVINVENALDRLWDLHDEGVRLLNAHHKQVEDHPGSLQSDDARLVWFQQWRERELEWRIRLEAAIKEFSPPEERRLRSVVTVELTLEGISKEHQLHLNILRVRLERLGAMLARHHPALLPE